VSSETMSVEEFKRARGEFIPAKAAKVRPRHEPGVMNKTEKRMDYELDLLKRAGKIRWYGFETHKLKLAKKTWFNIDFWIEWADGTTEARDVKGSGPMEEDARIKIKVAAEKFRQYRFTIWRAMKNDWQEEIIKP